MKAAETVGRLHGAKGKPREEDRKRSNRNFIIVKQRCDICYGGHAVRNCERYKAMSVDDRWKIAKEKNLCFRCLASNHQGKDCRRAKECGINGCKRNHHRLLHKSEESQNRGVAVVKEPSNSHPPDDASSPSANERMRRLPRWIPNRVSKNTSTLPRLLPRRTRKMSLCEQHPYGCLRMEGRLKLTPFWMMQVVFLT